MQSNVLIWFVITNFVALTLIAKAFPQSPDSLSLNANLFQVPVDDNSQELIFSSSNADPQAALNTNSLEVSSSDPQAGAVNTAVFNDDDDDFLTLGGGTSDDLFANSCNDDNNLWTRNEPSSCKVPNNQEMNPDFDLLQRLGKGDSLYQLLDTPPGSQEGSESLEDDAEKQRLLPPYDVGCDPEFPYRLCCSGGAIADDGPGRILREYGKLLYTRVTWCVRSMYIFALFSGVHGLFRALALFHLKRFSTEFDSFDKPQFYLNSLTVV